MEILQIFNYINLQTKVSNQQKAKVRSRSVVQKFGVLTGADARARIAEKELEKKAKEEKKRQYLIRTTRNRIKKELKTRGIEARKQEKARQKRVSEYRDTFVPIELLDPIPDPEKLVKPEDIELQLREALIVLPEFSGVSFEYTDSQDLQEGIQDHEHGIDPRLEFMTQQDFIEFPESEDEEEEFYIQL